MKQRQGEEKVVEKETKAGETERKQQKGRNEGREGEKTRGEERETREERETCKILPASTNTD